MADYYPYQCPAHLKKKLEEMAQRKRKETGESTTWSKELRRILDVALQNK
jgi:hypothetical protein